MPTSGETVPAITPALVTGLGSGFSVNCHIYIQGHDNTFTVANGAAVSDKFCYINYDAGSSNNAVVHHGHQLLLAEQLRVFVAIPA